MIRKLKTRKVWRDFLDVYLRTGKMEEIANTSSEIHFFTWKSKSSFHGKLGGTRTPQLPLASCCSSSLLWNYQHDVVVEFPPIYAQAHMLGTCDEYQPNLNIEKFHQVFITTLDIMSSPINPTVHMLLPYFHSTSCRTQHHVSCDIMSHTTSRNLMSSAPSIWSDVLKQFNLHTWQSPTRHLIAHDISRVYV